MKFDASFLVVVTRKRKNPTKMASSIRPEVKNLKRNSTASLASMQTISANNSINNGINNTHTSLKQQSTPNQRLVDYPSGPPSILSIKTRMVSDLSRAIQLVNNLTLKLNSEILSKIAKKHRYTRHIWRRRARIGD